MRRAMAALAITALALTGCGGTDGEAADTPSTSAEPTPSESTPGPSQDPTDADDKDDHGKDDHGKDDHGKDDHGIEIEIEGDQISPNGKRVDAEAGKVIRLEIDSDRAGELHVHSSPEQEIAFKKGESVVRLTVDTPGIVDVEEHDAGVVILQLEVR